MEQQLLSLAPPLFQSFLVHFLVFPVVVVPLLSLVLILSLFSHRISLKLTHRFVLLLNVLELELELVILTPILILHHLFQSSLQLRFVLTIILISLEFY